jgi:hypothetical protein
VLLLLCCFLFLGLSSLPVTKVLPYKVQRRTHPTCTPVLVVRRRTSSTFSTPQAFLHSAHVLTAACFCYWIFTPSSTLCDFTSCCWTFHYPFKMVRTIPSSCLCAILLIHEGYSDVNLVETVLFVDPLFQQELFDFTPWWVILLLIYNSPSLVFFVYLYLYRVFLVKEDINEERRVVVALNIVKSENLNSVVLRPWPRLVKSGFIPFVVEVGI